MLHLKLFIALLFTLFILLVPGAVYADTATDITTACNAAEGTPSYCSSKDVASNPLTGKNGIITKLINAVAFVTGVVAVGVIVYAGGVFVMSRGDTAKITTARQTILYAVIGLIVIIVARQLVIFILSKL